MEKNKYYWLVVCDKKTGDVKNAHIFDIPGQDLGLLSHRFEKEHQQYEVLDLGEGEENRPFPAKGLERI